eukprot:SAG31_NODE_1618_length_7732_cov_28.468361_6_plen_76_part_00
MYALLIDLIKEPTERGITLRCIDGWIVISMPAQTCAVHELVVHILNKEGPASFFKGFGDDCIDQLCRFEPPLDLI